MIILKSKQNFKINKLLLNIFEFFIVNENLKISLVDCIMEGRNLFKRVRKYL